MNVTGGGAVTEGVDARADARGRDAIVTTLVVATKRAAMKPFAVWELRPAKRDNDVNTRNIILE